MTLIDGQDWTSCLSCIYLCVLTNRLVTVKITFDIIADKLICLRQTDTEADGENISVSATTDCDE